MHFKNVQKAPVDNGLRPFYPPIQSKTGFGCPKPNPAISEKKGQMALWPLENKTLCMVRT